jgi:hypothetical protein
MRTFRQNPNPIDIKDFLQRNMKEELERMDDEKENWGDEFKDVTASVPTFRSSVIKLGKRLSEKLFSIELGRISF